MHLTCLPVSSSFAYPHLPTYLVNAHPPISSLPAHLSHPCLPTCLIPHLSRSCPLSCPCQPTNFVPAHQLFHPHLSTCLVLAHPPVLSLLTYLSPPHSPTPICLPILSLPTHLSCPCSPTYFIPAHQPVLSPHLYRSHLSHSCPPNFSLNFFFLFFLFPFVLELCYHLFWMLPGEHCLEGYL